MNYLLNESIKNLYIVFSKYPKPNDISGCYHCISEEEKRPILEKNLIELQPNDLKEFAHSGLLTIGTELDFKYLLPRLFEIVATRLDEFPINTEVIFSKLKKANWEKWDKLEIDAIKEFLHKLWNSRFDTYIDYDDNILPISELLCSISQCEDDISSYLEFWSLQPPEISYLYMFDFIYDNLEMFTNNNFKISFWSERVEQLSQIVMWMENINIYDKIEKAIKLLPKQHRWKIDSLRIFTKNKLKIFNKLD